MLQFEQNPTHTLFIYHLSVYFFKRIPDVGQQSVRLFHYRILWCRPFDETIHVFQRFEVQRDEDSVRFSILRSGGTVWDFYCLPGIGRQDARPCEPKRVDVGIYSPPFVSCC